VVILTSIACVSRHVAGAEFSPVEASRMAWSLFLSKFSAVGQTDKQVRQLMDKRFSQVGKSLNVGHDRGAKYRPLFLIDDFHQVEFVFDDKSKLLSPARIGPRPKWLRLPDGTVDVVPTPESAEAAGTDEPPKPIDAKEARDIAIRYTAHVRHRRPDSLEAFEPRFNADFHEWSVLVSPIGQEGLTIGADVMVIIKENGEVKEFIPGH
jgi:hypothetical protein